MALNSSIDSTWPSFPSRFILFCWICQIEYAEVDTLWDPVRVTSRALSPLAGSPIIRMDRQLLPEAWILYQSSKVVSQAAFLCPFLKHTFLGLCAKSCCICWNGKRNCVVSHNKLCPFAMQVCQDYIEKTQGWHHVMMLAHLPSWYWWMFLSVG